jgi:hypothetical protein
VSRRRVAVGLAVLDLLVVGIAVLVAVFAGWFR